MNRGRFRIRATHRASAAILFLLLSGSLSVAAQEPYDWRAHKARLERERKQAERFVGVYKRGEDEFVEFFIAKEAKYDWFRIRFFGVGKYDYEFAASDILFQDDGAIFFKIKGKPYKARRIDESLELTLPDGSKRYCPRLLDRSAPTRFKR
ncbi:MAG: hypothetical protein NZM06_06470 [Chloroherpetonaceae bacterium]|nr:hypothetical protein [Chloroherpetonaceae bacterium]MDW8438279.1 hypothetical protein [Chloroherpetonaceae bacterium]